jgi:hypothetical protein
MKSLPIALLSGALAVASAAVDAQAPERVRGTIAAFDGNVLSVKSGSSNSTTIHLSDKTVIVFTQPTALADIKTGDFLAVTSARAATAPSPLSTCAGFPSR